MKPKGTGDVLPFREPGTEAGSMKPGTETGSIKTRDGEEVRITKHKDGLCSEIISV